MFPRLTRDFGGERLAALLALATLAIALAALPRPDSLPGLAAGAEQGASHSYAKLPLSFIPNEGQAREGVRYYAQGAGFGFYFTDDKAVLSFQEKKRGQALELRFLGASAAARPEPEHRLEGKVNYMRGDDPSKWQTGLPTYGQVAYQGLWPGVDMRFRGAGGRLKYEFALKPGASPERIRLAYAGAEGLSVSQTGALLIKTPHGTLRDSKPRAWQRIDGRKVPVESRYSLAGGNAYGFELGAYDRHHPLVIDPGLAYSTYLAGADNAYDEGTAIAVGADGSAYVTGNTSSASFPTTPGAFATTRNGVSTDAFVTKLDPSGGSLSYSTYLGGTSYDSGYGIALDGAGNAYVTGQTQSTDFPTTAGAVDTSFNGGFNDAFVTKLNAAGSALDHSTYLGGASTEFPRGIAVDGAGGAVVTGRTDSTDFLTTIGAFDTSHNGGTTDAFVTKLNAAGSAADYSTFLGGTGYDEGSGIAADGAGNAYVAGRGATGFPTTLGAYDTSYGGGGVDAFVTKFDGTGTPAYSTFLGGSNFDGAYGVAIDGSGNAYVTGQTYFGGFPTTAGAFDTTNNGDYDAFAAKLDPAGASLGYSTFLGGSGVDRGSGIALDEEGTAYLTGYTESTNFPVTGGAFDISYSSTGQAGDAFVTKLNAAGSTLFYSTYLGGSQFEQGAGIAADGVNSAYVTGYTRSGNYPTTGGAFDTAFSGIADAFVTKLNFDIGYPRLTGGATFRAALVPAFAECTPGAANSVHGANLDSEESCNNPQPRSTTATLGSSTTPGRRLGYASVDVCSTQPPTGICSASALGGAVPDVRLRGNASDIVCAAGAPSAVCPLGAGSDYDPSPAPGPYTSNLDPPADSNAQVPQPVCNPAPPNPPETCAVGADMTAVAVLPGSTGASGRGIRITDSFSNLPPPGDPTDCASTTSCQATVLDQGFPVPVVCKVTADTTTGSYCGVNTTANALVPGIVVSGKAAVIEVGQVQVFDSGPDGTRGNADDELFAVQGIFIP